jgi:hypothetical protein
MEAGYFCHDHRRQPLVWLSFVIFTVVGGLASIYSVFSTNSDKNAYINNIASDNVIRGNDNNKLSYDNSNKSLDLHNPKSSSKKDVAVLIEPNLITILDRHPEKKNFLLFTLKNEGLVEAKSVRVNHLSMTYLKKENKIKIVQGDSEDVLKYDEPGHNWLFIPELKPNMTISKLTGGTVFPDNNTRIDILYFIIEYLYSDMKYKYKESIYIAEDNQIYSYKEYKMKGNFASINSEIKRALKDIVPRFKSLGSHKKQ